MHDIKYQTNLYVFKKFWTNWIKNSSSAVRSYYNKITAK